MMNEMKLDDKAYADVLLNNNVERAISMMQADINAGVSPQDVVSKGLIPAITIVGEKFQNSEIFVPEMIIAAHVMSKTLAHFKEKLIGVGEERFTGRVVIGTVQGDLHDIGKNLVVMILRGQGFEVEDLGVSVSTAMFIQAVKEKQPDILAMSALLTTTMNELEVTIEALQKEGLRHKVKVIVGGVPVTPHFAEKIGADGTAKDAFSSAILCKQLVR